MSQYTKYTAQGNDYIVIDPLHFRLEIGPEVAKKLCHRQYGLGADGLLYGTISANGTIDLKIFNADGSECGRSGNGLGIYAHYLYNHGYAKGDQLNINTSAGQSRVKKVDFDEGVFCVDAGPFRFEKRAISAGTLDRKLLANLCGFEDGTLEIGHVLNGNPHCVVFVKNIHRSQTIQMGRFINVNNFFIEGVNVQAVELVDRGTVKAEVFERGSGYTLSSAASACAISAVTHSLDLTDSDVEVLMPGGKFRAQITEDEHVLLTLKVTSICRGDFSDSYLDMFETA